MLKSSFCSVGIAVLRPEENPTLPLVMTKLPFKSDSFFPVPSQKNPTPGMNI